MKQFLARMPADKHEKIIQFAGRVENAQVLKCDTPYELILTAILLFGVGSIVRWMIGPSVISRAMPLTLAELREVK